MNKLITLIIVVIPFFSFSQFEKEYSPIKYKGEIPDNFLFDPYEVSNEQINNSSKLEYKDAVKFYTSVNYAKKELFTSNNIYFNDELTSYVRKVATNLFEQNTDILKHIKLYVTCFPSPNAVSLPDGSIFINIGLLSLLKNEAQLAFIIGHEVSHFQKQHAIETILKMIEIEKDEINNYNPAGDLFRNLLYSRENEQDADASGLDYIIQSKYNAYESSKVFEQLNDSTFLRFNDSINYSIILSNKILADTNLFYYKQNASQNKSNAFLKNSDYDDLFSTHPDLDKRIIALNEILSLYEYSENDKILNTNTDDYVKNIRITSLFELVNKMFENANYGLSLYLAMHLYNQYPDNAFINTIILKNLYWIAYYKEINSLDNVITKYSYLKNDDYLKFYAFLTNIKLKTIKQITHHFGKNNIETFKTNEDFYFYHCLASESLLGSFASNILFKKFIFKFPNNKYNSFVENKLNK